jgi:hypothetical protein
MAWDNFGAHSTSDNFKMVKDWWLDFVFVNGTRRKSFASLIMLTSWDFLSERNADHCCF